MLVTYELDGGVFGNVGRVWRPVLGAERKRMMEEGEFEGSESRAPDVDPVFAAAIGMARIECGLD